MRFVDQARIVVSSGKGGAGVVSFRREKFVPKGGPDGGDGGRGGDVIIRAAGGMATLYDFTHHRVFRAQNGRPGQGAQRSGRAGQDALIQVPLGTLIYTDDEESRLLADLTRPGQEYVAARGGRGGKGNKHFATSRNRTPRMAQEGEPGQELKLRLDLKLLADVALVGLPNAGKSTLISQVSAARPKIADYPFTTLNPNLGVVKLPEYEPFVLADVPGLIQGASQGVGLGHRFLRHVERTRLLIFLLDLTGDPAGALETLERELLAFNPALAQRDRLVVLNKIDLAPGEEDPFPADFRVSALEGSGLEELMAEVAVRLEKLSLEDEDQKGTGDES